MRTYGALAHVGDAWVIGALEPHAIIRLKALFPQIPIAAGPPFKFRDTPERAADLAWFLHRYPLAASASDIGRLAGAVEKHAAAQDAMEMILRADYTPPPLVGLREGMEIRPYQAQAIALLEASGGLLVGDEVGLGKTFITAGACLSPGALPAIVVYHAHLQRQWCEVIERFTTLRAHPVKGTRPYGMPACDVMVFRYSQIAGWADVIGWMGVGLVAFDEVQDLRRGEETEKGRAARRLADHAVRRLGLSATPIYNYGAEIWNVMRFLNAAALGGFDEFGREWGFGVIRDPKALGTYLRDSHVFIRRTKADVGQQMPPVNRIVDTIDYDRVEMASIDDLARDLAHRATTGEFIQRGAATRMLDLRVRHATGVAKAKSVATIARILVEGGTPIVLVGWHRDVYDIWLSELAHLKPALYTGSETAAGKNASRDAFVNGQTNLLIMSLRSGAGLDGLQYRASTMVFGELDWSPGVHHQCIGRLDREGQKEPVTAIFLVCEDGSDPPMMEVLGLKAAQASAIVDPSLGVQRVAADGEGLKRLVRRYLDGKGAASPTPTLERAA